MTRNWKELVSLLKGVLEKDGIEIIRAIMDRIYEIHQLPTNSRTIQQIEDLTEVKSMLETNTKNWEKAVFEKGVEKRDFEVVQKMAENGMSNTDIRKITGLSLQKIAQILKKIGKKQE